MRAFGRGERDGLIEGRRLLYLGSSEVSALEVFDFARNVPRIEEAYRCHYGGDTRMPKADYLKFPPRSSYDRVIPLLGYLGGEVDVAGLKLIGSSTRNRSHGLPRAAGLIVLIDPGTQRPFCVMEGAQISAARTATVTAVALKRLGPDCLDKIGVVGAGYIAQTHLHMLAQLYREKIGIIEVFDPDTEAIERFEKTALELGLVIRIRKSAEAVARGANVLIPMTTEEHAYVEADWLEPGSLYAAVSLLDAKLEVLTRSDLIVVDDLELSKHEGRPLEILERRGDLDPDRVVTIGSIVTSGTSRTRSDRVYFNPMGTVITDLVVAEGLFREARRRSTGRELPF